MRVPVKTQLALCEALDELNDADPAVRALKYALKIIENYELDIRESKEEFDVDLTKMGFCQGSVYRTARRTILRILTKGLRV